MSNETLLSMAPGTELGHSDWMTITQEDVNTFGRLTSDPDPYHMDPEFARKHSSIGAPISYGFLTMSMLSHFSAQVFRKAGLSGSARAGQLFNLGFDRLRLPEPVVVGAEIRGRFRHKAIAKREDGGYRITLDAIVDIKGIDRPALVAEWIFIAPG